MSSGTCNGLCDSYTNDRGPGVGPLLLLRYPVDYSLKVTPMPAKYQYPQPNALT